MEKKIDVLEIKNDINLGPIAGCWTSEWDSLDEKGIRDWFGEHKLLAFDNGGTVEFSQIIPFSAACFGRSRGQALIKLVAKSAPRISTPTVAHLH